VTFTPIEADRRRWGDERGSDRLDHGGQADLTTPGLPGSKWSSGRFS
jgi:hypothetical protein